MNLSAFQLTAEVFQQLLVSYLPITILAAIIGGGAGWLVAGVLEGRGLTDDDPHGWLRHMPIVGLLALGAIVLAGAGLPLVGSVAVLAILLLPAATVFLFRYRSIRGRGQVELALDRREILRNGWQDSAIILGGYVLTALILAMGIQDVRQVVHAAADEVIIGAVLGSIGGLLLGVGLSRLRHGLAALEQARRKADKLGTTYDSLVGSGRDFIDAVLTQFHGTSLTGVLAILAAVIPFTTADPRLVLAALIVFPLSSAMLAGLLVKDPAPDQPGFWRHLRAGFSNAAQIGVGYLVGTLLLVPLNLVHTWVLAEPEQVLAALGTHLQLTFVALGISLALGLVGGVLSSRFDSLRTILTNLGNVGRTIPSLAVLALALPVFGVGFRPSLVALIFIGTLPILINTTVGIIEVSAQIKEAARGMGFNDRQVLFRVELPIALPVIMAGIRTSAVLVVASATLAGFVGGGGLGDLIIRGDGSGRADILFTGAILATILSIFLEYLFAWLEALLTPRGLRS